MKNNKINFKSNGTEIYYKILTNDLTHNGFKYQKGLNTDNQAFMADGECGNGLFFADKENICDFLNYGNKIAKIRIPKGELISNCNGKYKAHSIEILEIHKINCKSGIKWMLKQGIEVNWDYISCYQKLSEAFIREFKDDLY